MKLKLYLVFFMVPLAQPNYAMHRLSKALLPFVRISPARSAPLKLSAYRSKHAYPLSYCTTYIQRQMHIGGKNYSAQSTPNIFEVVNKGDLKKLLEIYQTQPGVFMQRRDDMNALQFAATHLDRLTELKILLVVGPPIDEKTDRTGNTALHFAAEYGNANGMKTLLDAGASPDIKNKEGKTAFELIPPQSGITVEHLLKS